MSLPEKTEMLGLSIEIIDTSYKSMNNIDLQTPAYYRERRVLRRVAEQNILDRAVRKIGELRSALVDIYESIH